MTQLAGKVIVVTGGAGLLGKTFCQAIVNAGGVAVVADRDLAQATVVAEAIAGAEGQSASACLLDITDKASVLACIASVGQRYGRIDAVVNNAYPRTANWGTSFEEVEYADFCANMGMHVGGYFLVSQQFARFFRTQGHGNIVNMSSIYGVIAPRFEVYAGTKMTMLAEYAVIKAGILHLTRFLAQYLKGSGIRANAISPGGIFDNQPEVFVEQYKRLCASKGMLDKTDIAGTLVFLLSDASAYVNGQNITVDDGFSL